jgi:hypothetical protein
MSSLRDNGLLKQFTTYLNVFRHFIFEALQSDLTLAERWGVGGHSARSLELYLDSY